MCTLNIHKINKVTILDLKGVGFLMKAVFYALIDVSMCSSYNIFI